MTSLLERPTATTVAGKASTTGIYIVLLAQLMLVLDSAVMNVGLPHIQADLHMSTGEIGRASCRERV